MSEVIPHLGYLGASCLAMWVLLMYGGGLLQATFEDASILVRAYVISAFFVALSSALVGVAGSRAQVMLASPKIMLGLGLVASAGTACAVASAAASFSLPFYAGSALAGIGTGCIALRCATQFAQLAPQSSLIMAALMMACALVASALFIALPTQALIAVMVVLPLLSVEFSFIVPAQQDDGKRFELRSLGIKDAFVAFLLFLLILGVFAASGIVPFMLDYEVFSIRSASCVLMALAIMAAVVVVAAFVSDGRQLRNLYYAVLVVLLLFYVVVAIGSVRSPYLTLFFSTASITLNVVVWGFLSCLAHYAGLLRVTVLGFGRTMVSFGVMISWLAGSRHLLTATPDFLLVIGAGLVTFVLAMSVVVFGHDRRRLSFMSDFDAEVQRRGGGVAVGSAEETVSGAGEPCGTRTEAAEPASELRSEQSSEQKPERQLERPSEQRPGQQLEQKPEPAEPPAVRAHWRMRMMLLADAHDLTRREAEVFFLLSKGRDAQMIADELHVSLSTVRTHVRNIYAKCDVHSRHELQSLVEREARELEKQRPAEP